MTFFEPSRRRRDTGARRRRRLVRAALVLAAAAVLFGIGVAVGQALHDNPKPGGTQLSTGRIFLTTTGPVVSK